MNLKKISVLIIITLLLSFIFLPKAYALSDIINQGKSFVNGGTSQSPINTLKLKKASSSIYNIFGIFI